MSDSYFDSPSALLAVAFPPQRGLLGACVTIGDLAKFAYRSPRLMSRTEAARLVMERNLECRAPGHGNRAQRRIRSLRLARTASSYHNLPLSQTRGQ